MQRLKESRLFRILRNIVLYFLAFCGLILIIALFFAAREPKTSTGKGIILVPTYTPTPARAPKPTAFATIPLPTAPPKPTDTPTVVPAATPVSGVTVDNANLRSGPGITYPISGTIATGQAVAIVDKNDAGDWYQLDNNAWIAAFLVSIDGQGSESLAATPTRINIRNDAIGKAYAIDLVDIYGAIQDSMVLLGARFSETSNNPSVILTSGWRGDVSAALAVLKASTPLIRQLNPPPYFIDVHNDFIQMADHLDKAVDLLSQGLGTMSRDQLTAGGQEIRLASSFMVSAKEKLDFLATQIDK